MTQNIGLRISLSASSLLNESVHRVMEGFYKDQTRDVVEQVGALGAAFWSLTLVFGTVCVFAGLLYGSTRLRWPDRLLVIHIPAEPANAPETWRDRRAA